MRINSKPALHPPQTPSKRPCTPLKGPLNFMEMETAALQYTIYSIPSILYHTPYAMLGSLCYSSVSASRSMAPMDAKLLQLAPRIPRSLSGVPDGLREQLPGPRFVIPFLGRVMDFGQDLWYGTPKKERQMRVPKYFHTRTGSLALKGP